MAMLLSFPSKVVLLASPTIPSSSVPLTFLLKKSSVKNSLRHVIALLSLKMTFPYAMALPFVLLPIPIVMLIKLYALGFVLCPLRNLYSLMAGLIRCFDKNEKIFFFLVPSLKTKRPKTKPKTKKIFILFFLTAL